MNDKTATAAALVSAIIAEYGATTCAIDKGSFIRVEGAVRRAGNLDTSEGFDVACEGETYRFYTIEIGRSRQRGGDSVTYRMEQY